MLVQSIGVLLVCAIALLFAAKLVFRQLHVISEALRLPPFFVASILVALSTSIPEAFVGITSAVHGQPEFALGNIIGANILGLTLIAGIVLVVGKGIADLSPHIDQQRLVLTFAAACMPVIMLFDGKLSRTDGALLLFFYALYVAFSIYQHESTHTRQETVSRKDLLRGLLFFLVGIAILLVTSDVLYQTALSITQALGASAFVVGVFALSFSTTLPEITFGIRSALEKRPELSLADVVGSSVVNSCGILGVVALLSPISPLDLHVVIWDGLFFIGAVLLFYRLLWQRKPNLTSGYLLFAAYLLFIVFNFVS